MKIHFTPWPDATRAPFMRVECLGIRLDGRKRFAIRLGKILETRNYRPE